MDVAASVIREKPKVNPGPGPAPPGSFDLAFDFTL
jgi:hypothetical protein